MSRSYYVLIVLPPSGNVINHHTVLDSLRWIITIFLSCDMCIRIFEGRVFFFKIHIFGLQNAIFIVLLVPTTDMLAFDFAAVLRRTRITKWAF